MEMILVENLSKSFKDFRAVDNVSFQVREGEIFGFLGPNGAGKSTTIKILCTLLKPSGGRAWLNGYDIIRETQEVRRSIGLVFQDPSLDEKLTARENLLFHAMLYGVPSKERDSRITQVLELVELIDRDKDIVKTFSGGMKRRLEIARGLIHHPKVLFLDEPTVGLDPQTRNHIWDYIRELQKREGITIFLTTHYMDEAEHCDRIAIIDYGQIVALDSPAGLKKMVGGDVVTIQALDNYLLRDEVLEKFGCFGQADEEGLYLEVDRGEEFIPKVIGGLTTSIKAISLRKPTLDDVFLKITGRAIRDDDKLTDKEALILKRRRRRVGR